MGEVGREKSSETSLSFGFRASKGKGIGLPADTHVLLALLLPPAGGDRVNGLSAFLGASREY